MPQTTTKAANNHATVKAKIQEMNDLAKDADTKMRETLQARNQASANLWRERRDHYNAEARRLTDWLNAPPTAASPCMTPEEIRQRLNELPYKIQYANKMLMEYQRVNNTAKINEWAQELRNLEAEQTQLLAMNESAAPLTTTPARSALVTPAPMPPAPTTTVPGSSTAISGNDFIITVADTFNTSGNQDSMHNSILQELLEDKYRAAKIPVNDSKAPVYKVLRGAPYPGLRPYHEDEQGKFFGRDADAEVLIDKVLTNRLTLLFAASGVGKSSLLQAAVIPRLKSPTGENLAVVYHIDWVSEPVSSVRASVLQALHASGKLPEGAADDAGETLAELLEFCGLFVRHPLVLILDQFEEFFRYQQATASFQPFIEQLTAVIINLQLPVSLMLSMREDFALELNAFKPRLPTILFENFYRLEKLGREDAREAIITPVEQIGFRYEPVLLETLLDDLLNRELDRLPHSPVVELQETVEPPYLQIICAQLWELNKVDPDKLLRLETYEKADRARGIIKNYFDNMLKDFPEDEKEILSKIFSRLVIAPGVKVAYTDKALAKILLITDDDIKQVLDKLEKTRLLRKTNRGEEIWYELYHDMFSSCIDSWEQEWRNIKIYVRGREYSAQALPPPPNTSLDELLILLDKNREIIKESQKSLNEAFRKEVEYAPPWELDYDSPIQDAIIAHINIHMLVPLINLKGGSAHFEKPETLPVPMRMNIMRNIAEKMILMKPPKKKSLINRIFLYSYCFTLTEIIAITLLAILLTKILRVI